MTTYECSIETCGFSSNSPLGMTAHARAHRNAFADAFGRQPTDYAEVRAWLNDGETPDDVPVGRVTTLGEFA